MTPQEVLSAAKQGNPQAIAALMNHSLKLQGITAKAKLNDGCLQVMLEGATVPNQAAIVPYVTNGIKRLGVTTVKSLAIYGKVAGDVLPTWREHVELTDLLSITQPYRERFETASQEEDQVRCPNCSSIQVIATKKGFGTGKAALGAVLLGPVGLAGGMIGSNKILLSCLKCGHQWNPSNSFVTAEAQIERRVTQTKIKVMTAPERIAMGSLSVIGVPILGLIVLIFPVIGWFIYLVIVIAGVLVVPTALLIGHPKFVNSLVGECPHCRKTAAASLDADSIKCLHCKKQIIVRDQQFYTL